ncbi:hypothetical protein EfaeDRAFT_1260, partial [Enterococcus faecium DO]
MADETKPTRKGSPPIKVYCLPDERRAIEEKAAAAGMSLSAYLLAVGQGYKITGVVDYEHVRELARINGDLGRLGGLLKLWLTDDPRTARFGDATILALLAKIEEKQDELGKVMMGVVLPEGRAMTFLAAKTAGGARDCQARPHALHQEERLRGAGEVHHDEHCRRAR